MASKRRMRSMRVRRCVSHGLTRSAGSRPSRTCRPGAVKYALALLSCGAWRLYVARCDESRTGVRANDGKLDICRYRRTRHRERRGQCVRVATRRRVCRACVARHRLLAQAQSYLLRVTDEPVLARLDWLRKPDAGANATALAPNQRLERTRSGGLRPPTRAAQPRRSASFADRYTSMVTDEGRRGYCQGNFFGRMWCDRSDA